MNTQEPVAWMVYTHEGQSVYVTDNPTDIQKGQTALPLFTTPPAQPAPVREDWGPGPHEVHSLPPAQPAPVQEPVAWRNAAIRVGEDLCSVGPFGYYDMTAEQWLDWALSVVTVHAPPVEQREWVGLTDEEIDYLCGLAYTGDEELILTIQSKLKEKNNG